MKRIATILATAVALLVPASPVAAHGDHADRVESCKTKTRVTGTHVTRVKWESGRKMRRVNLTVKTRLFPGERKALGSRGRKLAPRVTSCRVNRQGAVVVRTESRARFAFVPPATEETPQSEPTPTPVEAPRPLAVGRWATPTTLYAPVAADWQPDAVLAAWNAALPADRQVARTHEPCATADRTCIDVEVLPMARLAELHAAVGGIAWWQYDESTRLMIGCSIDLAVEVAPEQRPGVLAHELGHCLGLPHWEHSESVMSSVGAHAPMPAAVDLQWIVDTYGVP